MCAAIPYRFILERQRGSEWVEVGQYSCEAYAEEAMSERMVEDRVRICRYEARLARMWDDEFYHMSSSLYGSRYRIRSNVVWVPDEQPRLVDDGVCLDDYEIDNSPVWLLVLRALLRLVGFRV